MLKGIGEMIYSRALDLLIRQLKVANLADMDEKISQTTITSESLDFCKAFVSFWDQHIVEQKSPIQESFSDFSLFCQRALNKFSNYSFFPKGIITHDLQQFILAEKQETKNDLHKLQRQSELYDDITILREIVFNASGKIKKNDVNMED